VFIVVAFLTPRKECFDDEEEDEMNHEIAFELSDIQNSLNITPVDEDKYLTKKQLILKTFVRILIPIEEKEWSNSNYIRKLILILKLPIMFFVQLTTPIIDKNEIEKLTLEYRFKMFIQMILGPQFILQAISGLCPSFNFFKIIIIYMKFLILIFS
jgi:hypothetical protein